MIEMTPDLEDVNRVVCVLKNAQQWTGSRELHEALLKDTDSLAKEKEV